MVLFWQNKKRLNDDAPYELRDILNEIDAKEYLIAVAKRYKIPIKEQDETKEQLSIYKDRLSEYYGR